MLFLVEEFLISLNETPITDFYKSN